MENSNLSIIIYFRKQETFTNAQPTPKFGLFMRMDVRRSCNFCFYTFQFPMKNFNFGLRSPSDKNRLKINTHNINNLYRFSTH